MQPELPGQLLPAHHRDLRHYLPQVAVKGSAHFLVSKTKGKLADVLYLVNKLFSLLLGVVMVLAFIAQYPFISTRTYATFSFPLPYTVQYMPMAIAGAFIALKSVVQIVERGIRMAKKTEEGKL